MSFKSFRFFNNTGGMNLRFNELLLQETEAESIQNMQPTQSGSWTTENIGYVQLNESPLATGAMVHSLYHYTTDSGTAYLVAGAGGKLHTFNTASGSATVVSDTLSLNQRMEFVTFQGILIGCNGVDAPFIWSGTGGTSPMAGWPPLISGLSPGMPSMAEIFANRLVFTGDSQNPSVLYLSALEDPETFTPTTGPASAGAIQVSPGDGERITAIKSLYLPIQNQEILVIFKERSTYILTGSDADDFQLQQVSSEFGAVGPRAVTAVGNELMFLSQEGVTTLTTATVQGNLVTQFLSGKVQSAFSSLNRNQIQQSMAVHLRDRQEVWWVLPPAGSSENQWVMIHHYGLGNTWSKRIGLKIASAAVQAGQFLTGNYGGFIHEQLRGNRYHQGSIAWHYRSPFYDLGSPKQRKRLRQVEVYLKQIAPVTVSAKTAWDFRRGSLSTNQYQLPMVPDVASPLYTQARYGADLYGNPGVTIYPFIPDGSGFQFQLEWSGNTDNQPVEILGWTITAIYGGLL